MNYDEAIAKQKRRTRRSAAHCVFATDCGCELEFDALVSLVRAVGAADGGCERRSKKGTCVDKGFAAICWGCQAKAEADRLAQQVEDA